MKVKIIEDRILVQYLALIGIFFLPYFELCFLLLCMCIILKKGKSYLSHNIVLGLIILSIHGLVITAYCDYESSKTIQQIVLLTIALCGYSAIFRYFAKWDMVKMLFPNFLRILYFVSVIGLIQYIIYYFFSFDILGYMPFTSHPTAEGRFLRIHSICPEPSTLGTLLIPFWTCLIFYREKLSFLNRKQIMVMIIVSFLTISSILYLFIGIMIVWKCLSLIPIKLRIISLSIIFLLTLGSIQQFGTEEVNGRETGFLSVVMKVTQTASLFKEDMTPEMFEQMNLSTYATGTNFWIALNAPSRLLGTGIGTHKISYEKLYQSDFENYGLNSSDGYSLFNRIFSEFGYIGLLLYLIWLYKNFNYKNSVNVIAILMIAAFCVRGGHYVMTGCVFFHTLLHYTSKAKNLNLVPI